MLIDDQLLDELSEQAKESLCLRMNQDLRNSPNDSSQRILNASERGTYYLYTVTHRPAKHKYLCEGK